MKRIKLLFLFPIAAAMLFSGCSEKTDPELEGLISDLPTVNGNPLISASPEETDNSLSFISVNGTIKSVSKDSFSLLSGEKFYFNDSTGIFGGALAEESYVTVTYNEADKSEKKIYAVAVTILNGGSEDTAVSEEITVTDEISDNTTSEKQADNSDETPVENTAETTSEEATEETDSEETAETSTEETTEETVSEENAETEQSV